MAFFRRQGTCTDPYQGVNVRWVHSNGGPVNPGPQCANGNFPNSLMQTAYSNWAPRLGIAYTPTVRGHSHGVWHVLRQ